MHNLQELFDANLAQQALSEKQQAVLQASLTLFADQGFDRTTTKDIAQLAQVSEGTVYKQFKTKQEILAAILVPFARDIIPQAANEFLINITNQDALTFADFLQLAVKDRLTYALDNRRQIRILIPELLHNPELVSLLLAGVQAVLTGSLATVFKRYQDQGELVAWPAGRIMQYVFSIVISYGVPAIIMDQPVDVEHVTQAATEFLLRGLSPQED